MSNNNLGSDTKKPLRTAADYTKGEYVTIKLKANPEKTCRLPKALLGDRIPFFEGLFFSGFRETSQEVVELDEVTAEVFDPVVDWLWDLHRSRTDTNFSVTTLIRMYRFADEKLASTLKDYCLEQLHIGLFEDNTEGIVPTYADVIEASELGSWPLLQLLIDSYVLNFGESHDDVEGERELRDSVSSDFFVHVMEGMSKHMPPRRSANWQTAVPNLCSYHGHKVEENGDNLEEKQCVSARRRKNYATSVLQGKKKRIRSSSSNNSQQRDPQKSLKTIQSWDD